MNSMLKDVKVFLEGRAFVIEGEGEPEDNPESHAAARELSTRTVPQLTMILLWEILRELKIMNEREEIEEEEIEFDE